MVHALAIAAILDQQKPAMYHPDTQAVSFSIPARHERPSNILRIVLYAVQAADAMQSARAERMGLGETNPMMQPFAHGALPMAAGFAIYDILQDKLLSHASEGTLDAVLVYKIKGSLSGIAQTDAAIGAHQ